MTRQYTKMDLVKAIGDSIFYVWNKHQLIECNLLSKQKYVHRIEERFIKIYNYYISKSDKIFIVADVWGSLCYLEWSYKTHNLL